MVPASLYQLIITGILIASAGAYLGSFALLRRMALVGDALSHVALPGIALGVIFHFNIFWGALAFLVAGTTFIWAIEHKTKLPVDALVGIFFTLALAVGALLIPEQELAESLFGDIGQLTTADFWIASGLSLLIILSLYFLSRYFALTLLSEDLALSVKLRPHILEFLFLLLFALAVAVGIKFAGALLMGSLIIIPAAAARNVAVSLASYQALAVVFGAAGVLAGVLAFNFFSLAPAPVSIIFEAVVFFGTIFIPKIR